MATFGTNPSSPPSSVSWNDSVAQNREWWNNTLYTMPAGGGIVTSMDIYMGGYGMTATVQFCIWDASNTLVWSSPASAFSSTVAWKNVVVSPTFYLAGGNYYLGFYAANGQNVQWEGTGSAPNVFGKQGLSGPAANTSGANEYGSNNYGTFGVYVTYTPGGVAHVMRAGTFQTGQIAVERSGTQTNGPIQVMRNGSWVYAS